MRRAGALTLALAVVLGLGAAPLAAQHGRVSGTVTAAETGVGLAGARVTIEGTALSAVTDERGRYLLARVPAGRASLRVAYIGRAPQTATVTVTDGGIANADFAAPFGPVVLEELRAIGARALSQAEALSRQQHAPNIVNVVASDQIGRFPDASAPEAVQRLPGVAVERDQGEGRYIQIRGGSAANTLVTYNGVQIPSPEGENRQVALDAVPVDILESIEVTKALLPSMDADAIGGSVNLVTRHAPAGRLLTVEGAAGIATIRDRASGSGAFTFGNRSRDGRLGFLVSGSYSRRRFGSDNIEPSYDLGGTGPGDDTIEEMEIRHYTVSRSRQGGTAMLDWRPGTGTTITLSGLYSKLEDEEQRRALISVVPDGELTFEHKNRYEYDQTLGGIVGGEHLLRGGGKVDWQAAVTRSRENQPYDTQIAFLQEGVTFAPVLDANRPATNPASGAVGGTYEFDEIESTTADTRNRDLTLGSNVSLPFDLGAGSARLRFGAKLRAKKKTQSLAATTAELNGGSAIVLGADIGGPFDGTIRSPDRYPIPPFSTRPDDVLGFRSRFASQLDEEQDLEAETNDYDIDERVASGYLMAELDLSSRLLLVPGVRLEHTKATTRGFEFDADAETLSPTLGERSYARLFPSVHLRYAASERTNLRAAVSTAIARPNFFDLVPFRIRDGNDVVLGNPDLDPTTSVNFDLLLEHYDQRIGVMSAGAFYKRITDPIFVFTEDNTLGGETEQPRNGESGWIRGIEVAFHRQLGFLPRPFHGVGLYANYTFTDSKATLPGGRAARLQGQADHVFNTAVSYERGGFSSQASLNYHDDYVSEYGDDPADLEDVFVDRHLQLDLTASQRLGRAAFFLEVVNLTNEPFRVYQGIRERPIQLEFYERWARLGVRFGL